MKTNWINVEYKLPSNNQKVLCATVYIEGSNFIRDYFVATYTEEGKWYGVPDEDVVTHWAEFEEIGAKKINYEVDY